MDPLSVSASIIAVLNLTYKVIQCLSDIVDAPQQCQQCAVEISNLIGPLTSLRYLTEEARAGDPWFEQMCKLNVKRGPIQQYEETLTLLQSRIDDKPGLQKIKRRLLWTISKEEVAKILGRAERLKSLVIVALEMDHL